MSWAVDVIGAGAGDDDETFLEVCTLSWVISTVRRRRSLMERGAPQRTRSEKKDERVDGIVDC